jgi:KTSC domain
MARKLGWDGLFDNSETSGNSNAFFEAIQSAPVAQPPATPQGYAETFFPDTQNALKPSDSGVSAEHTQIPTSSSFSPRPRTLAAWWEQYPGEDVGDLIVIFRDGTPWVYVEVPESVWINFKGEISKGTWLKTNGDNYQNYKATDITLPANVIIKPENSYYGPRNPNQIARPWAWKRGREARELKAASLRAETAATNRARSASTPNVSASKPNTSAKGPRKKK